MVIQRIARGRVQIVIGVVLLTGLVIQCQRAWSAKSSKTEQPVAANVPEPVRPDPGAAYAATAPAGSDSKESLEALAARDPLGFMQMALDNYDRGVRDYTCTFCKQELIGGKLTANQIIAASFREKPFSVRMEWKKNPDRVARVLYVADRWVEDGRQMAMIEPAGAVAQLFVSHVMRPIEGAEARKNSRKTINQFGLRNNLVLILKYAKLSREQNALDLSYKGNSEVAGRPTLVFERRLPYAGEDGPWPDRLLIVHVDREMLLPVLCISYADDDKKVLLAKYQSTDIKLNPNLPDSVFTKEGMGL